MRRLIATLASFVLIAAICGNAAPRKKHAATPARKTAGKTVKKGSTTAHKKSTSKKRRTAASSGQTWRSRQLSPTPDRYREIQQALVDKGYLKGEPTGSWDEISADALKRFQQEQNLTPTGKINSLSLIALGLGPKHETAAITPPVVPPRP